MTHPPSNNTKNLLISLAVLAALGIAVWAVLSLDPTGQNGAGTGRDYDKDFQKLMKFDLSLLKWTEVLPAIPVKMDVPLALAVSDDGNICLAGDKSLVIMSPDGQEINRFDLSFKPQALTTAGKTIYIASRNAIVVMTSTGQEQARWSPLDSKAHLVSLAASDQYVYAADAGNRVVMRYDRKTGKRTYKDSLANSGAFLTGFNVPSPHMDIAITSGGNLLTVNPGLSRVQVRDSYGDVLDEWGAQGAEITKFYGCCNPAAIAILAGGSIVTYEKTLQRLKVYSPKGEFSNVAAGPNEFSDHPKNSHLVPDIAVDLRQRILLLDPVRKVLRIFKRKLPPRPSAGASQ
ncbi:MAG: hypothetical protein GY794_15685 [bacterium]|nr:hypothetical protein [bacterium]